MNYTINVYFLPCFQLHQWFRLDPRERENLARRDFDISVLPTLLKLEGSVSLMLGRVQFILMDGEEDDFYGLRRLFFTSDVYVDWRVRLRFIQSCFGTVFYLGNDVIFKT